MTPARTRWSSSPRLRRLLARIVVISGIVLAAVALITARWGLLLAAIIVVSLGAALGPARIRRD
jgi:hypothetical protein